MAKELIPAPTTGVLMSFSFKNGDSVVAGDVIAVMEVMKLMFNIESQSNGVIKYLVGEGDLVAADDIVAEVQIT